MNSEQWWQETKSNPDKLNHWLQRQYVGEYAAVNLLSQILLKFAHNMTVEEHRNIHSIMLQEALHANWMYELLQNRQLIPEANSEATQRYWHDVLPNVTCFKAAMQAAHQAENMRLFRIRAIANDPAAPSDIRETFKKILPHEEWHEEVFGKMQGDYVSSEISDAHQRGLNALNLVLV